MRGAKWVALFLGFGLVGYGGDSAAGLLAQEPGRDPASRVDVPAVDVDVDFDMDFDGEFGQSRCAYGAERRVSVGASAAQLLRLDAGSGSLSVEGRSGLSQVQAVGTACASDEGYLQDLQLTLERAGNDIVLTAHYPDRSDRRRWGGNDYARIDLVVEIPMDMAVNVDDSSGEMEISGTGALDIRDSSGGIVVDQASGPVTIDDSSGGITVRAVRGDVDVEDSSGDVDLSDVTGSVRLRDGSGSVQVEQVTRDVIVDRDGSGSITVRDVGGDFAVRADGSGGIRYSGVQGNVDVPVKRHGRRGGG